MAKKKAKKKKTAVSKRKALLTELAQLAVSPRVTPAMAADKLGMTPEAFERFLQEDQEAGRVWRHAQIDALRQVGTKLWDKAKGGDAAAARQILQSLQERIGSCGDLSSLPVKAVAGLLGEKPARLDYWYRKHGMPKRLDGTVDLKAFLEWYRRWLISENTFDPMRVQTVPELEPLVGVSKVTVFEWLKQGMPRNTDKSFSLPAVFKWLIDRVGAKPQTAAAPVNPLADRKARKLQIEVEQLEKTLVPRLAVELGWIFYASSFSAILDRKEGELPGLLADCKTEEAMKDVLSGQFEQIRQVAQRVPDDICSELPPESLDRIKTAMEIAIKREP